MGWLVTAEIVSLLMGLLLLFADQRLHKLSVLLNQPLFYLDSILNSTRIPIGVVLVIVGGWLVSIAVSYSALWYLGLAGIIFILFGLLYLFLPSWLDAVSKISDRFLFSTDNFVLGARKSIGIILIVCALYIFFAVYLSIK